jgi:tetratricopeptide (TPR) repeat protein
MNEYLLDELQDKARYHRDHEQWLHAAQVYYRILAILPDRLETYFDLATMYSNMDHPSAAEEILLKALKLSDNNSDVLFALGVTMFKCKDYEKASKYLEQLLPNGFPKVHYYVGAIALEKNDLQSASRQFQLALSFDEKYKLAYHALCDVSFRLSAPALLIETASKGSKHFSDDWKLQLFQGIGYIQLQKPEMALPQIRKAVALKPNDAALLKTAADAVAQTPYIGEAESLLLKALQLEPDSPDVLVSLGMVAVKRANKTKAMEYFTKALELDPENDIAMERLQLFTPIDRKNA